MVARGGATRFTQLGLDVRPRRGMAVVHFPAFRDAASGAWRRDLRTLHEGAEAIDDKWLIATWMWRDAHPGAQNRDTDYPSLSPDVI